jgi:hypothetical protein
VRNSFFLVIPEQQADPVRLKLYEEAALQQWVEELPIVNLALSTRLMHDFILESNKLLMSAQQRMDFLELIRPHYLIIEEDMRSRLMCSGFPKSDNEKKIHNVLVEIEREYTIAYWIVVKEQAGRYVSWFQGKNAALAIQRTIKGLSSIVISQYIMSLPVPEWVWIDIHSLYKLGVRQKKETTKIADEAALIQHSSTIQDSYKQVILLSLADPTGLLPKEIMQVYGFAERLTPLIAFEDAKTTGVECSCVILQDEDLPPRFVEKNEKFKENLVLYINFKKLYKAFDKKEKLKNSIDGRYGSLELSGSVETLPMELLLYLEARWFGIPLNGAALFADRLSRYFTIGLDSTYELQSATSVSLHESEKESLAESNSKTALVCAFDKPGSLSIGSLISFRKTSQPEHKRSVGVVNKISVQKGTNKIEFEIMLLTQRAHVVTYSLMPEGEKHDKYKALIYALKAEDIEGAEERSMLIVESFMLKEQSVVRLYLNDKNFPIVLRDRKNIGAGYWQFDCRQLEEQVVATKSNKGYDFT